VEPVNDSLRMRPSRRSRSDTPGASLVVRTPSTPSGSPSPRRSSAKASDVSGVCGAGLRIAVQPAASAGAIFAVAIASGKFHGVMSRHGPTGPRWTRIRELPSGDGR
jgi:hypothetical protein